MLGKTKESFEQFMKFFKDSCEVNNILTLDQKIDYLVHLRNTTNQKKDQSKIKYNHKNQYCINSFFSEFKIKSKPGDFQFFFE